MNAMRIIRECKIIPVVVIDDANNAISTAKALLAGGINVMEITFRTDAAAESIAHVSRECPNMLVGAGTIVNLEQCKKAVMCGAKFIVSPGYNEEVVAWCIEEGITVIPGCVTPTEIMTAINQGLTTIKFFPANVYGGLTAMKALAGPFTDVTFIPTGGVNADNLQEYVSHNFICAVGGSWLCSKKDINEKNYDKITELCKEAREKV